MNQTDFFIIILMFLQTIIYGATLWVLIIQNRKLTKSININNYQTAVQFLKDLRQLRILDPSLAKVYKKEIKGLSEDEIRFHFFNLIVLSTLELLYAQNKAGFLDDDTWNFWLNAIKRIAQEKSFQDMLVRSSYKIVNPEFEKIIRSEIQSIKNKK